MLSLKSTQSFEYHDSVSWSKCCPSLHTQRSTTINDCQIQNQIKHAISTLKKIHTAAAVLKIAVTELLSSLSYNGPFLAFFSIAHTFYSHVYLACSWVFFHIHIISDEAAAWTSHCDSLKAFLCFTHWNTHIKIWIFFISNQNEIDIFYLFGWVWTWQMIVPVLRLPTFYDSPHFL